MSITTTSPDSITRSDTSWCGLAPFGPDPTITNAASACPSARIAAVMSAPTWASVRPGCSHSPIRACTRSIASPAARSRAISAGSLRMRSVRSTGPASACGTSGNASRRPRTWRAGMSSSTAVDVGPPDRSLTSRCGSSPSVQVTSSMPSASSGTSANPGASSAGTTSAGGALCPVAGTTRQVSRSCEAPVKPVR